MIEILNDTDLLLSSDSHFLLGNWIEDAKSKAKNEQELDNYELNARLQITLWGKNYSQSVCYSFLSYYFFYILLE